MEKLKERRAGAVDDALKASDKNGSRLLRGTLTDAHPKPKARTAKAQAVVPIRTIVIPEPRLRVLHVTLEGLSPVITNKMSRESIDAIERIRLQGGSQIAAVKDRSPLDIQKEVRSHIHYVKLVIGKDKLADLKRCEYGLPAAMFKKCLAAAGYQYQKITAPTMHAAVNVLPEVEGLARMKTPAPSWRRGYGNLRGTFLIYYQPVFWPWSVRICLRFDEDMITDSSIINLLQRAGNGIGIGNNRPGKGGENGTFMVTKVEEGKKL